MHAQDEKPKSKDATKAIREFEKVNERLSREYLNERDKLDTEHNARFEANRTQLLAALQAALEKEAKAINLEEANRINRVLEVRKANNTDLPSVDNRQGRGRSSMKSLPDSMLGDWVGTWGTTGNTFGFHLSKTEDKNYGKITFKDERILLMERRGERMELIPYNESIIVLGYSRSKRKHPDSTLPNHIGVATRKK